MKRSRFLILFLGFLSVGLSSDFQYFTFNSPMSGCHFQSFNFSNFNCEEPILFPAGSFSTVVEMESKDHLLGQVVGSKGEFIFEKKDFKKKASPGHIDKKRGSLLDINLITKTSSKALKLDCPPSLINPVRSPIDPDSRGFYENGSGNYLDLSTQYRSSSRKNKASIAKGSGISFGEKERLSYCRIKKESQSIDDGTIQWDLRNLDEDTSLAKSKSPDKFFYGASVSKVFVAGAYLNSVKGNADASGKQELMNMIVESNNASWRNLQNRSGGGDARSGMREVDRFLKEDLGITKSNGFRGDLGSRHGNEISTSDLSDFIQKTYDGSYRGSEDLLKTMFLSRTGSKRGKKYFPSSMTVGGKTGTYKGATRLEGRSIQSRSNHHTMIFQHEGKSYSLSVLSDPGNDETVAILSGGIIRDYLGVDGGLAKPCD